MKIEELGLHALRLSTEYMTYIGCAYIKREARKRVNDKIYCDKCSAENEVGSSFCKKWGADIHDFR